MTIELELKLMDTGPVGDRPNQRQPVEMEQIQMLNSHLITETSQYFYGPKHNFAGEVKRKISHLVACLFRPNAVINGHINLL